VRGLEFSWLNVSASCGAREPGRTTRRMPHDRIALEARTILHICFALAH